MEEQIFERPEGTAHRLAARMRAFLLRPRRAPRFGRGTIAAVALGVLAADLAVVGVRSTGRVVPSPAGARPAADTGSAATLPPIGTLEGPGPFAVYAVENAGEDRIRVFATDLGAPGFRRIFLGEYPGFVTDYAGAQGQAGGRVVPINTAQETTDASRATRLWLLRRGQTARRVLSTFDFVSAYALNRSGDALAISRRSVLSPARGAFLWLYPLEPPAARQVGSLRRPGGSGPASQLRPLAWGVGNRTIFATPFCDQCADDGERGLFVVSPADGRMERLALTGERSVVDPSFSADGSRFVFQERLRIGPCPVFERCEERRLIAVDLTAGKLRIVARSRELSFDSPVLSLDGKVIAYASGRGNEIVWRSFATGEALGAMDVGPSEEVVPAAWIDERRLLLVGRTSSAKPDGPSEGNLFRLTRLVHADGSEAGAHIELVATDSTLTLLGWLL